MKPSSNRTLTRQVMTVMAATASMLFAASGPASAARAPLAPQVQLDSGKIEGMQMRGQHKDLRVFRGIPYAAAPVNELRFREPQPVPRWADVRAARQFAARCMQPVAEGKSDSRAPQMSEDCLYLNVWTPARDATGKLPVLVHFHGGGFVTGDASQPRYDGANLASRGIVVVTVNYRLGVFGFLAPPEATSESSHGATGNYGLLDQAAALRWVRQNIAQFGGDPSKVTIAGNSAGSISVSAHMASPLSRGLFAGAIGESGAALSSNGFWRRDQAEAAATKFATRVGAASLQQLRSLPAKTLLVAAAGPKLTRESLAFWPSIDGHFLTDSPERTFANGGQAQVPLLVGANSHEASYTTILGDAQPTPENWQETIKRRFKDQAEEVLAHYPGNSNDEVMHAATALAGDFFIGHSTWQWMDQHRQTGNAPVFYYRYTQPLPPKTETASKTGTVRAPAPASAPQPVLGAAHDAQLSYSLGNLGNDRRYAWTAADYDVSRIFSSYVEQFVKTGDPNGTPTAADTSPTDEAAEQSGGWLPRWPAVRTDNRGMLMQIIGEKTHSVWDREAPRQGLIQRLVENGQWAGLTIPAAQAEGAAQ